MGVRISARSPEYYPGEIPVKKKRKKTIDRVFVWEGGDPI
jgi:hypothetical protein